jgi:signal transduction histidine kinase
MMVAVSALAVSFGRAQEKSAEDQAKEAKDEALAKESAQKCEQTASTKATPKMIIDKVNGAAELVAKEGKNAFPKFKGKGSEFIFAGTYIWIHNLDGVMLVHPIKPKMETTNVLKMRDPKGKEIFSEMNRLVTEKSAGWYEYSWPKPGQTEASPKVSYVKLVKKGDESFVIGCGVYDMTLDDIQKAEKAEQPTKK